MAGLTFGHILCWGLCGGGMSRGSEANATTNGRAVVVTVVSPDIHAVLHADSSRLEIQVAA